MGEEWLDKARVAFVENWEKYCGSDSSKVWLGHNVSTCFGSTIADLYHGMFILYAIFYFVYLVKLLKKNASRARTAKTAPSIQSIGSENPTRCYTGRSANAFDLAAGFACVLLAGIAVASWVLRATSGPAGAYAGLDNIYPLVNYCFAIVAWLACLATICMEVVTGQNRGFGLRLWWLANLIWSTAFAVRDSVEALVDDSTQTEHYLFFASYVLYLVLALLAIRPSPKPVANDPYQRVAAGELKESFLGGDAEHAGEEDYVLSQFICPEEHASWLSVFTFGWINPLLTVGSKRSLELTDLWQLPKRHGVDRHAGNLKTHWEEQCQWKSPEKRSLLYALHRSYGWPFYFSGVFLLIQSSIMFMGPWFLQKFVHFNDDLTMPAYVGYLYVVAMFACKAVEILAGHQYQYRAALTGMQLRAGVVSLLYGKAMMLSSAARRGHTTGEIVNMMSVDVQKLIDVCMNIHTMWSLPVQIVIALYMLWQLLGVSMWAGVGVMIAMLVINYLLAKGMGHYQKGIMENKDNRMKVMNEVMSGMKIIKMYAWEESFLAKILGIRKKELSGITGYMYTGANNVFFLWLTPLAVSVATFACYTLLGNDLKADMIFASLAIFRILQFPLRTLPTVISTLVQAIVSYKRIRDFANGAELDPFAVNRVDCRISDYDTTKERPMFLSVTNGTFRWDEEKPEPTLRNININVPRGSLVAIAGPVGSGKSSLLSAMMGNLDKICGNVTVKGTIAYVSQQAWIQNATVRDNILFGLPYEPAKYRRTVEACALERDFELLPAGDETEIGERGLNMSGGQKQRIAMARAVYQDADIYLLDDPLSAVDAHVAHHLFHKCVNGILANKARILVTHSTQFLEVPELICVMENGGILECGSYQELLANGSRYITMIDEENKVAKTHTEEAEEEAPAEEKAARVIDESKAKIVMNEERETGTVGLKVYGQYMSFMGGFWTVLFLVIVQVVWQGTQISSDYWLQYWAGAEEDASNTSYYLGIYSALAGVSGFAVLVRSISIATGGIRAAKNLHNDFVTCIMRAPMAYFDSTPIGRIMNRASNDLSNIDQSVPFLVGSLYAMVFQLFGIIFVMSFVTPFLLIPLVPLSYLYWRVQQHFLASSRELTRLDSTTKSPVIAHFQETLNGVDTVRAFDAMERFKKENARRLEDNLRAYFPNFVAFQWLSVRLEFVGATVLSLAALLGVLGRGHVAAGLVGMSLTYALSLDDNICSLVLILSFLENQMVSVERMIQYSTIPSEAEPIVPGNRPEASWPANGAITFDNVEMKYREHLDSVLKNISIDINPREKIGVVGRTGAGKSSLSVALFRLVELYRGRIFIDGVDVGKIGLRDLRSKMSVIPQDPVLFSGTVRFNLDPFNERYDYEIWDALERAHLKQTVSDLPLKLEHEVSENGSNFSVGQRQLICLARALLRKSTILLMDEATASVDNETDALIQKTIREGFKDQTVLTIAHRINTIIDNDRVLVMESGEVAEFDAPSVLLADPTSKFYGLVRETL